MEKGVTYEDGGVSAILADVPTTIRLFGWGFSNRTEVRFATELKSYEEDCDDTSSTRAYPVESHFSVKSYRRFFFDKNNSFIVIVIGLNRFELDEAGQMGSYVN